jgi:hypothetical protein
LGTPTAPTASIAGLLGASADLTTFKKLSNLSQANDTGRRFDNFLKVVKSAPQNERTCFAGAPKPMTRELGFGR